LLTCKNNNDPTNHYNILFPCTLIKQEIL
jgi:hypothetical protein